MLHDFADYLLATVGAEEMQEAAAVLAMQGAPQSAKAKRNSELLNSLLGLPKNILKSGRK